MILCAEYGLHFAKEDDHWRCVEYPDLLMLPGPERYRVGERTFASLDEALRHRKASEGTSPTPVSKASGGSVGISCSCHDAAEVDRGARVTRRLAQCVSWRRTNSGPLIRWSRSSGQYLLATALLRSRGFLNVSRFD